MRVKWKWSLGWEWERYKRRIKWEKEENLKWVYSQVSNYEEKKWNENKKEVDMS